MTIISIDALRKQARVAKMTGEWAKAGDLYLQIATHGEDDHEKAFAFLEASQCFEHIDKQEAIKCLQKSLDIDDDSRSIGILAKHQEKLAFLLKELAMLKKLWKITKKRLIIMRVSIWPLPI